MKRITLGCLLAGALGLAACAGEAPAPEPEATPQAEAPQGPTFEPEVSINQVMVDLVNDHATDLWSVDLNPPETDENWIELRHAATGLTAAGSIIAVGGNGDGDMEWASRQDWDLMAQAMTDAGARALAATEARDVDQLLQVGDELVNTCISCHRVYRLDVPEIWSERAQEVIEQ